MAKNIKRLLSLAVVLFMVVSMLPANALPVAAAETAEHQAHCVCGGSDTHSGCTHTALEGEWKPWDGKSNISESGNYYLTQDVTGSTQYWMGGAYTNTTEMTINLCTNGHSIDSNYRVFGIAPYVTFNLMNCSATESVLQGAANGTDTGGAIHMHAATCVFNLYDNVKIVAKTVEGRTPTNGGVMCVPGVFNMYGGELVGKTVSNTGGALHVTGTFNMYDGTIIGGSAGWAGSVNVQGTGAKMTMTGGLITGGTATFKNDHGGNIYVLNGAEVTISGGTVSDGKATGTGDANGGNIAISNNSSTTSKLTINGNAQILGGQANRGGSIFHHSGIVEIGGNAYIGAGRVIGGVDSSATLGGIGPGYVVNNTCPAGNLTITGNPTIEHLYMGTNDASVGKINFVDLGSSAKIHVMASKANAKISAGTLTSTELKRFTCADIAYSLTLDADGYLTYTAKDVVEHCVCGDPTSTGNPCAEGGHEVVTWQAWTDTGTLPFVSGYWYLPTDLNFPNATGHTYYSGFSTSTAVIGLKNESGLADYDSSLLTEAQHVYVDLNGKTVTEKSGHRAFRMEPGYEHSLTITDSVGFGSISGRSSSAENAQGMIFWGRNNNHTWNVYGGTLDASRCVVSTAGLGGAAMHTGYLNMYGGTIIGGTANSSTGGAVNTQSVITMTGDATIIGGTGTSGGAVSLGANGKLNMSGNAKIVGGYSSGSGAYGGGGVVLNHASAELNMSGNSQIIGGEKTSPNGAVFVSVAGAKVTLSDNATITAEHNTGIMLVDGAKVYVGSENYTGKVSVASKVPAKGLIVVDSTNLTPENSVCFTSGNEGYVLEYMSTGMRLNDAPVVHCVCGDPSSTGNACAQGGHKQVTWQPWPYSNVAPFLDGYWYLDSDLDLSNANYTYFPGFVTPTAVIGFKRTAEDESGCMVGDEVNVYIDLNGKTITGKSGHRVFRLENDFGHSLTITDTVGGGQIKAVSPATNKNKGMLIWTRNAGSQVTIYGGKLDASNALGYFNGGALNVCSPVYMYGGEIVGSTNLDGAGAAVYTTNAFYLYNGTITGGTANSYGGCFAINGAGTVGGKLYVYGGTITGGTTNYGGGNIGLYNGGYMNMTGGVVENGTANSCHGGNINLQGGCSATITGGIVRNGKTVTSADADPENPDHWDDCGGNIAVVHNTENDIRTALTVGGSAQILNGEADRGGNIFVHSGELTVQGQAKILGGTARKSEYGYADDNTSACIHINRNRTGYNDAKFVCKVTLAGMPEITEISYRDGIEADGLNMMAKIGVNRCAAGQVTTTEVSAAVAKCFTSTNPNYHCERDASGYIVSVEHTYEGTTCQDEGVCSCGKTCPTVDHNWVDVPGTEPDCENTGLTEGVQCDMCGEWKVPQSVIPANGHTAVIDAAEDPDCENTGLTEGEHCDVCGDVLVAQTVVPALGHSYTQYTYNKDATVYADGTETAACDNGCGTTHTRTAEGTKLEAIAQIGDELYKTVAEAAAAAEGKTIVLLGNADENVVLPVGASLNLNGYAMGGTVTTDAEGYMVQRLADVFTVIEIGDTVAYNAATGALYTDFMDALEATDGTNVTLQLVADVAGFSAIVPAGVTLDLNGCTAEFDYFTAVGGVIDSKGEGLLATAQGKAILLNQEAMPVWNGEGYTFISNIKLNSTSYTEYQFKTTDKGLALTFMPWLASDLRAEFADGAADNGISMKVRLAWNGENGTMEMDVNYNDSFIVDVYDDYAQAFSLVIANADELDGLTFTIVLVSNTGATFTSQTFSAN